MLRGFLDGASTGKESLEQNPIDGENRDVSFEDYPNFFWRGHQRVDTPRVSERPSDAGGGGLRKDRKGALCSVLSFSITANQFAGNSIRRHCSALRCIF